MKFSNWIDKRFAQETVNCDCPCAPCRKMNDCKNCDCENCKCKNCKCNKYKMNNSPLNPLVPTAAVKSIKNTTEEKPEMKPRIIDSMVDRFRRTY